MKSVISKHNKFNPQPKPQCKEKAPKVTIRITALNKGKSKSVLMAMREVCDKLFSKWIKVRDCENGFFKCCTCGKLFEYKKATCGHFVKRGENAVRLDERNAHAQCALCNGTHDGKQKEHAEFIDKKYGKGTAEELRNLSKQPFKLDRLELEKLIEKFKN